VIAHLVVVSAAGAVGYLVTLRTAFPTAWRDLAAAIGRVVPDRARSLVARRAAPLARGAASDPAS
jgi:hypothetical protein